MSEQQKTTEELILEVLREVLERQRAEVREQRSEDGGRRTEVRGREPEQRSEPQPPSQAVPPPVVSSPPLELEPDDDLTPAQHEQLDLYETWAAAPVTSEIGARRLLLRLLAGLFIAILLINIPLFKGLPLARALPDSKALIVRDGLVFKGPGPEIYVLENNRKRWISSLEAFKYNGFTWEQVRTVDQKFVERFPDGPPLHVLLKCAGSPHIYRIEAEKKRWIKDIATFKVEGHVWEDVRFISCPELRRIPDGVPIPPDAGEPPQP